MCVCGFMDACKCMDVKTHTHIHVHKHNSNSLSNATQAKSRLFVLKTISSLGKEAIEQHYRHYRRLSLEIGFTSIPWLITICRQQQSEGGRVRETERKSGRRWDWEKTGRKRGKKVGVVKDWGGGRRQEGKYTLYYLWISAKGYRAIFQMVYYLLIYR